MHLLLLLQLGGNLLLDLLELFLAHLLHGPLDTQALRVIGLRDQVEMHVRYFLQRRSMSTCTPPIAVVQT